MWVRFKRQSSAPRLLLFCVLFTEPDKNSNYSRNMHVIFGVFTILIICSRWSAISKVIEHHFAVLLHGLLLLSLSVGNERLMPVEFLASFILVWFIHAVNTRIAERSPIATQQENSPENAQCWSKMDFLARRKWNGNLLIKWRKAERFNELWFCFWRFCYAAHSLGWDESAAQ